MRFLSVMLLPAPIRMTDMYWSLCRLSDVLTPQSVMPLPVTFGKKLW